MRYFFLPVLFLFSAFSGMQAQDTELDLNLALGFPLETFRENTDAVGFGGDLNLMFPVSRNVAGIHFGINATYMVYGFNNQREVLTAEITAGGTVIDRIDMPLEIKTSNNILGGHAVLRFTAPLDGVAPFVQGMAGFRRIATDTRILDDSDRQFFSDREDRLIVSQTNLQDWVFSYGGGGGVRINLGGGFGLNLAAHYLLGGEADYYDADDTRQWEIDFVGANYDPGNLEPGDLSISAIPKRSRTNMLLVELGINLNFGRIEMNDEGY